MINDILFCLLGVSGGIFIDNGKDFIINDTITFLSESEKERLKVISQIGYKYKLLKEFSSNYESMFNSNLIQNKQAKKSDINSVYLSGVSRTINELLHSYDTLIEQFESKLYMDQSISIAEIVSRINPYIIQFDQLYEFLQYIIQNNLLGGDFLNYIYEKGISGDPNIKLLFKLLFINCNIIFNNMVSMWIINNSLSTNEFFIVSSNNFIVKEHNGEITNPNNPNINQTSLSSHINFSFNTQDLESWSANFYIEKSNIPIYFPNSLAEDILFVGKAIKILNSNKNSEDCKIPFENMSIFYSSLQKLNSIIFKQNEDLNNLIDIDIYMKLITLIKNCVSKYLWKLVVNKNGFINHLNGVKNIFLTFHGEFYYNFIIKIHELLNLPTFDKRIENEINEVYFKNSLKEVFHIDTDNENHQVYNGFKIKLISSGFSYIFKEESNVKSYLEKKDLIFLGGFNYDTISSCFRMINTTYKSNNGCIWVNSTYDLDEEFIMTCYYNIKNFTKKDSNAYNSNTGNIESVILMSSQKNNNKNDATALKNSNNNCVIYINFIIHIAKNFPKHPPGSLNDLINYFNFQFEINYSNKDPSKLVSMKFCLYHCNQIKSIILDDKSNKSLKQKNDHEIEIYKTTITDNIKNAIPTNDLSNIQIGFKDNYCVVSNENKSINFSFPFMINQFIPKDKRKMIVGLIVSSDNLDITYELVSWNFNFYSGDIYNENSNMILINYNPPWPHNFIFNENILKMYNLIFNLVFPLKTSLTMLNQLWVDKKNKSKQDKHEYIFKILDSVHAEFVNFLQNLISFYMFDVIEVKFKTFYNKMTQCKELEELMQIHEEFLAEVITNSFVKSRRTMRTIFDVLFIVRKFHNYVINLLRVLERREVLDKEDTIDSEKIIGELSLMKDEFKLKVGNLINSFSKIKNTKHFNIISQLLARFDYS